jgi:hypothetical protein
MAEDPVCLHVVSNEANDLGAKACSSARKKPREPKHVWSSSPRLEIARGSVEAWLPMLRTTGSRNLDPECDGIALAL